jgi:hypothetical protein
MRAPFRALRDRDAAEMRSGELERALMETTQKLSLWQITLTGIDPRAAPDDYFP